MVDTARPAKKPSAQASATPRWCGSCSRGSLFSRGVVSKRAIGVDPRHESVTFPSAAGRSAFRLSRYDRRVADREPRELRASHWTQARLLARQDGRGSCRRNWSLARRGCRCGEEANGDECARAGNRPRLRRRESAGCADALPDLSRRCRTGDDLLPGVDASLGVADTHESRLADRRAQRVGAPAVYSRWCR
jgi:hypothetical protein